MGSWIVKCLMVLLAVGAVLAGVILLGQLLREDLRDHERYLVAFADIECIPPPGQTRGRVSPEECAIPWPFAGPTAASGGRVGRPAARGFARHPWVESVASVEVAPPRHVRVKLVYRTPVLAVPVAGGTRAVDVHGILLPPSAPLQGLPLFTGHAAPHVGSAGTRWGDAAVEAAARGTRP